MKVLVRLHLWWEEALAAGAGIPEDPHVWHYKRVAVKYCPPDPICDTAVALEGDTVARRYRKRTSVLNRDNVSWRN